jgi:methylthioribose-1-phosphate isomerase
VSAALEDCLGTGRVEEARDRAWTEARRIQEEDLASCRAIGVCGARHLRDGGSYLTHCNTGALATGGHGTALGVFRTASAQGKRLHVWVDETRPYLQGARLTAWELAEESIPATLVCDAAAASLMASGRVEAVLVGADRITRRGWVANKLGTYGLAVLARHHGVPFFVAAPLTSFDASLDEGRDIPIEERNPLEVLSVAGTLVAPRGFPAFNPAFDLTPPELVSAFFTDQGELLPPYGATIPARLMEQAR